MFRRVYKPNLNLCKPLRIQTFGTGKDCVTCEHRFAKSGNCSLCQVQKVGNYFDLMDVHSYEIDLKELKHKYKKLQSQWHPDLYVNKSRDEQKKSELISTQANKAYNALKDPLSRAHHYLKLNEMEITEQTELKDKGFLCEVMEIQEQIQEEQNTNKLKLIENENENRKTKTIEDLTAAFRSQNFIEAQQLAIKLNYWYTIQRMLQDKL